jgi:hypothetical protein
MEETGVSVKNHRPVASHWQTWSHKVACLNHAAHMPQACSTYASSMQHICLKTCSNFHFIFEGSCRMLDQLFVLCVMYLYFLFWPPLWIIDQAYDNYLQIWNGSCCMSWGICAACLRHMCCMLEAYVLHDWGKDREGLTISGAYSWWFMAQGFRNV